ncbi:putative thiol methyltransferase [Rosellinia necatrix]|uniref:Putative thiol methyltransferase n=1 Tax=Rosellinia necatrix TaxID=77044 RepID=A0A1S7UMS6_ROSNE|nr:putative thiol methyltransferase [Rosellinia necatrix]
MSEPNPPPPTPLPELFAGAASAEEHAARWSACWDAEHTPWDRGGPSPALRDLLEANPGGAIPIDDDDGGGGGGGSAATTARRKKTALVPGCGRGHDVLLLAERGYDVWGLDVSPQALAAARAHAEGSRPTNAGAGAGAVAWLHGDFFAEDWGSGAPASFDLIFDYTFFCALPPSMRPAWAARMRSLLRRPGGRLLCLEFPVEKSPAEPGPPWAAPPAAYLDHLSDPGGLRRLVHVKPTRTHQSGTEDGRVQDFISVWAHVDE